MNESIDECGTFLARLDAGDDFSSDQDLLDLGMALGQRRAFAAVGGRCSAAHARLLRRIRDQKLYRPVARCWREFCGERLTISRRTADRLIALLDRFGTPYFELAELIGITPAQYAAIEPAIVENRLLVDGEAISLLPENAPRLTEAIYRILSDVVPSPPAAPAQFSIRLSELVRRGNTLVKDLNHLYHEAGLGDRDRITEVVTQLRISLLGLTPESPNARRGA